MSAERRRHRVFRTRHTEYHLRDDEVVGVRDRETGLWILNHAALRLRALRLPTSANEPGWIGRRLAFWSEAADVVTSPVVEIDRPERVDLGAYVSAKRSGEIDGGSTGDLKVAW